MKKIVVSFLILLQILLGMIFFFVDSLVPDFDDRASKQEIRTLVEKNQALLLQCMETEHYEPLERFSIIQQINTNSDHVDFYCGGAGFGPSTSYCGFYYSAEDDLTAIWCAQTSADQLIPYSDGYLWEDKDGDNRYYVEKICGHFYYYEASF